MRLTTPLCARFGVVHPILNAPMGGGDASGTLAAAVSNGGGLGMIGGTTPGGVPWLVDEIRRAQDLTDGPFGVGLLSSIPERASSSTPQSPRAYASSRTLSPTRRRSSLRPTMRARWVLCQVRSRDEARRAADAGVGAWIGTRFLATHEAGVSDAHKDAVIAAAGDDTVLTRTLDLLAGTEWPDDVAGRAIREPFTDARDGREAALLEHLRRLTPDELAEARRETRRFWAGAAASFVVERESAADVVGQLAGDAARVLAAATSDLVSD